MSAHRHQKLTRTVAHDGTAADVSDEGWLRFRHRLVLPSKVDRIAATVAPAVWEGL